MNRLKPTLQLNVLKVSTSTISFRRWRRERERFYCHVKIIALENTNDMHSWIYIYIWTNSKNKSTDWVRVWLSPEYIIVNEWFFRARASFVFLLLWGQCPFPFPCLLTFPIPVRSQVLILNKWVNWEKFAGLHDYRTCTTLGSSVNLLSASSKEWNGDR